MKVNLYKYNFLSTHFSLNKTKKFYIFSFFHSEPNTHKEKLNLIYPPLFHPPIFYFPLFQPPNPLNLSNTFNYILVLQLKSMGIWYIINFI